MNAPTLDHANAVRLPRAALMRRLRSGELAFRDLDLDDPCLRTMPVFTLLQCLAWNSRSGLKDGRWVNRGAVYFPRRVLTAINLSERLRLSDLSDSRKQELKLAVGEICPTQRGR